MSYYVTLDEMAVSQAMLYEVFFVMKCAWHIRAVLVDSLCHQDDGVSVLEVLTTNVMCAFCIPHSALANKTQALLPGGQANFFEQGACFSDGAMLQHGRLICPNV